MSEHANDRLTSSQLEALRLAARGITAGQAAKRLGCDPRAVSSRITRAIEKLGARNQTHAVALAITRGVLTAADLVEADNQCEHCGEAIDWLWVGPVTVPGQRQPRYHLDRTECRRVACTTTGVKQ